MTSFVFLPADGVEQVRSVRDVCCRDGREELPLLVFHHDEALLVLLAGGGPRLPSGRQPRLPHRVGHAVAQRRHDGQVARRPLVQVEGAHAGDVRAQLPVDARALDADQHAQVNAGPVGICNAIQQLF